MHNTYILIGVMAITTYMIRMIPLVFLRKEVKSPFIKSFLYYVPFVSLAVMIFPGIIFATPSIISGITGLITALALSWKGISMVKVSIISCIVVYGVENLIGLIG